ncbi:RNA polymerase sigma factor, sigma-70 family [Sediminibacillus halophilus]|uniref:RNA polymerase sigma factor, sigma-70 family n=1 Tax=Sediminibacillus halophilus TaxID=482461 RepID=A0A1G9TRY1_9BACI|nr:RNA polymerase sigma factor, sigma-70 family [Sediminibacillus halophilus]
MVRRGGASIQDELLIKKIKTGNQQALRLLIERYKHHVFKVTMSVLHDEKAAEDAAQETFIKMVDALPSYQHQGFKTWLGRIAFHKAIDSRRKQQRMKEDVSGPYHEYHHGQVDSAEEQVLLQERKQRIRDQIEQLPEKLQFAVRCYYLEGMSYAEIANQLDLAEKTIEVRLYRARKWMKAHWKEDDF